MANNQPPNFFQRLAALLDNIQIAAEGQIYLEQLLADIGWQLDALNQLPGQSLQTNLETKLTALLELRDQFLISSETPGQSYEQLLKTLVNFQKLLTTLAHLSDGTLTNPPPEHFDQLGQDLVSSLTTLYFQRQAPFFYDLATLLTLVRLPHQDLEPVKQVLDANGNILRRSMAWPQLDLTRLIDLLTDPLTLLKKAYLPEGESFQTLDDLSFISDRLFARLYVALNLLGVKAVYGMKPGYGPDLNHGHPTTLNARPLPERMLTITWPRALPTDEPFGFTLSLSPKNFGNLGLVVIPFGPANSSYQLRDWQVDFILTDESNDPITPNQLDSFALSSHGAMLQSQTGLTKLQGQIKLTKVPPADQPAILIGASDELHLKVDTLGLLGNFTIDNTSQSHNLGLETGPTALVLVKDALEIGWERLQLAFQGGTNRLAGDKSFIIDLEGLTLRSLHLKLIPDLDKLKADLHLVYDEGKLVLAHSWIELINPPLGKLGLPVSPFNLGDRPLEITEAEEAYRLCFNLGAAEFKIKESLSVGWENLKLELRYLKDETLTLREEAKFTFAKFNLKSDLIEFLDLQANLTLTFNQDGFLAAKSSVKLLKPEFENSDLQEITDQPLELKIEGDKVTFTLGATTATLTKDLTLRWQQISLVLELLDPNNTPQVTLSINHLNLSQSGTHALEAEVSAKLLYRADSPPHVSDVEIHKPDLGQLGGVKNFYLDPKLTCLVLQWEEADLNKWLRPAAPNFQEKTPSTDKTLVTLRLILKSLKSLQIQEIRLDGQFSLEPRKQFKLPGFNVEMPQNLHFTLLIGGANRDLNEIAFILNLKAATNPDQEKLIATSSLAWGRETERELHNKVKDPEDFFELAVYRINKAASMILVDFKLEPGSDFPTFFQELTPPLKSLDFDDTDTLCQLVDFHSSSLSGSNWKGEFKLLKELKFPFLQPQGSEQFIKVDVLEDTLTVDMTAGLVKFDVKVTVQVVETLKLATLISPQISWKTFALKVEHERGLKLFSSQEKIEGTHFGLTWRFIGTPSGDKYHYCNLLTQDNNYSIQQAKGAKLELEYGDIGQDPVVFEVENFQLLETGVTLSAKVTDRPVRLNGLDTKFRFTGGVLEIVDNKIKGFTIEGSGPLPPDLVGEAMVDIALQFEQDGNALRLVEGKAKLALEEPLKSPDLGFQISVDEIGLKFVNDGKYHLYFTLTGSAAYTGDGGQGALGWLSLIQINFVECPLTGDARVLLKHINFLVPLPSPIPFSFLGCFEMEIRGFAFLPQGQQKVFSGAPALQIAGQVKFGDGGGDAADSRVDYHNLFLGLPDKGEILPRLSFDALPLRLALGEAFKLSGVLRYLDDELITGFSGSGTLQIQGLPTFSAAFSFVRARRDESSPWVRAWFIYLQVERISFEIPVVKFYLREVGLGFGYRYTLASIKAADQATDVGQLIKQLRELSRTQANLTELDNWAIDLEDPGESPRWTLVLRALFSQTSSALTPTDWRPRKEEELACVFLFDAIISLRSDFTFFMAVRAWFNTNYYAFHQGGPSIRSKPLLSGFVLLTPRPKRFLAHVATNPDGYIGDNPPLLPFVKRAIKNSQFSATLLIEPGLFHYEMGWPNQLRWSDEIGLLKAEFQGGFIFRITKKELVTGTSFLARATLKIGTRVDLGFVGAAVSATVNIAFGARYIGVLVFDEPSDSAFYGAIGLEARLDFALEAWIRFQIKIKILGKKIRIRIEKRYRLSRTLDFTAGLEVGLLSDGVGLRGSGTLAVSALGHSLSLSVALGIDEEHVELARTRTESFLQVGLEASDVEGVPGVEPGASPESAVVEAHEVHPLTAAAVPPPVSTTMPAADDFTPGTATDPPTELAAQPEVTEAAASEAETIAAEEEAVSGNIITAPEYIIFVIRNPADGLLENGKRRAYFVILPRGEGERGFLPVPPNENVSTDNGFHDFEFHHPDLENGVELFHYHNNEWEQHDNNTFPWKANWGAVIEEVAREQVAYEEGYPSTDPKERQINLKQYLRQAFKLKEEVIEVIIDNEQVEVQDEVPHSDPDLLPLNGISLSDERLQNPSASAFEAAVRGATTQFRASPYFKRDENYKYDRLLGQAFDPNTSIYNSSGQVGSEQEEEEKETARQNQKAHQIRGTIIQNIIADLREYANAPAPLAEADGQGLSRSIAFKMGLVFKIELPPETPWPIWLKQSEFPSTESNVSLKQRTNPYNSTLAAAKAVRTFNVETTSFAKYPPQFQKVQHFTNARTIAITWDLVWPTPPQGCSGCQKEPEHHLLHYQVRRRALDSRTFDEVYTVKAASILHRDGNGITSLKPRFQIVEHFTDSLETLAALPTDGLDYLYSITPVDMAGAKGHPLTLTATRYPSEPPQVPLNTILTVPYHLAKDDFSVPATPSPGQLHHPEVMAPEPIKVTWSEPAPLQQGPQVAIARYRLIFRRSQTLPIGSYGLDASTQGSPAKSLPTNNAQRLPTDRVINLNPSGPPDQRLAHIKLKELQDNHILPSTKLWQPESWRVFIQTISGNEVSSALAPVKLLLRAEPKQQPVHAERYEERQPAELEWLPQPLTLPLLPPEDLWAIDGPTHVPMPTLDQAAQPFTFDNILAGIKYQPHPANLRAIRFRWNQGANDQPNYPLELNAGYTLWQLDVDAHTTATFANPIKLGQALRSLQEVQMLPADELPLTPNDTLTTNQWEAWYPSARLRLPDPQNPQDRAVEGSQTAYKPWYSWRESILIWPEWPGLTDSDTPQRETRFHPLLEQIIEALDSYKPDPKQKFPEYQAEVQISPPNQPHNWAALLEQSDPAVDPYAWGILQHFGLSLTFMLHYHPLHPGRANERAPRQETLTALKEAFDRVNITADLKQHLHLELLFQPGQSISLQEDEAAEDSLLAMLQLSLRPALQRVLDYAQMELEGPSGAIINLLIPGHPQPRSMIIQAAPVSGSEQPDPGSGQIELDPNADQPQEKITHTMTLPINGKSTILLRSKHTPEHGLDKPLEIVFLLNRPPVLEDDQGNPLLSTAAQEAYDSSFKQPFDGDELKIQIIKPTRQLDAEIRQELGSKVFKTAYDAKILDFDFSQPQIFLVDDEQHKHEHSTYFTIPSATWGRDFSSDESQDDAVHLQWKRFVRYVEALNGQPAQPAFTLPTEKTQLEPILPDFLGWSGRFFTAGGGVNHEEGKTNPGPWLATAYPRPSTPAYTTPEPSGRLKYDHLLEDRWAHNYRYYIQPFSRYDLLWQSFRQSPQLLPSTSKTSRRDFRRHIITEQSLQTLQTEALNPALLDKVQALKDQVFANQIQFKEALKKTQLSQSELQTYTPLIIEHAEKTTALIPDPNRGGLDMVIERTQPVDKPLILRSSRLDAPPPPEQEAEDQQATGSPLPGPMWEVVVAQHREQALSERNQTLARQLAFRQVAFTLLRKFANPNWLATMKEKDNSLQQIIFPQEKYPDIPLAYPDQPDHLELNSLSSAQKRSLALPTRLDNFQQGALVLQWEGLPYYYEHRLLLVAQTASQVSLPNQVIQQDFEYRSPQKPVLIAEAPPPGGEPYPINAHTRQVHILLQRFWDCLPESAQQQWPDEDPQDPRAYPFDPATKPASALPDPDVIYELVETFSGNVEVRVIISFDQDNKNYTARRIGPKFKFGTSQDPDIQLDLRPPTATQPYYALETFTLSQTDVPPADQKTNKMPVSTKPDIPPNLSHKAILVEEGDQTYLNFKGFMSIQEGQELQNLFPPETDKEAIQTLFDLTVSQGVRQQELKIRARRGSAKPSQAQPFIAPRLPAEDS